MRILKACLSLVALALPLAARAGEISIHSDFMAVGCDTNSGRVWISRAIGEPLLDDLQLGGGAIAAGKISPAAHKVFGAGQSLEITHANGARDAFSVFQGVPFALIRSSLSNAASEALITNKVPCLSARVTYWKAATALKTFGTGGLLDPDNNPGSYAWLGLVEPQTRTGLVFGWLTHDRASGVLFTSATGQTTHVSARLDYGRLRLAPGKDEDLETLIVGHFTDVRIGLEEWADAVAKMYDVHLPPQPNGYCTWYSRPHGRAADEAHIAELAKFAKTNLAPFGFSVVQIDDGWQEGISTNGPKRNFTTHRSAGPYPQGMKAAADEIRSLGLVPGLWFMPFAGTYYDPFFSAHQDWFVKRASDSRPYETAWGGACLDMTDPGARQHLSNEVRRIAREWGYGYLKIDGLWTGTATKQQYVNSGYREDNMGDAVLHNPDKTNIEAYRDGLRLLREAAGPGVFVLGCNGPQNMRSYAGAFGLVDGMRVGPDNGSNWKSLMRGPVFGSRHYFLHGRIWYNDPDPVYVRADMPLNHAQLICSWVALSGQMNLSSEWLPGLPAERLDILKRTMPAHGRRARPVDLFENDPPRLWVASSAGRALRQDVAGLFNWTDAELQIDYPLDKMGVDPFLEFDVFDYWGNRLLAPIKSRLRANVPPQSCQVLALRIHSTHPQVISTSRHVTQGMLDVLLEKWDAEGHKLRGRSQVIGGDPYELRVVAANAPVSVVLSPEDQAAGAAATFRHEPGLLRVSIQSRDTREVWWEIKFP